MQKKDCMIAEKEREITALKERMADMQVSIQHLMNDLQKNETIRKHLHNHIQILKGNIRVFCRVKPLDNSSVDGLELRKSSTNQNCINLTQVQNELPSSLEL
jgi:kinesin family protein C1